ITYYTHLQHFLSIFHLSPTAPISTLFPYTTLFRSETVVQGLREGYARRALHLLRSFRHDPRRPILHTRLFQQKRERDAGPFGATDRKSTRLNSSHSQISYAVFCLKKKNAE